MPERTSYEPGTPCWVDIGTDVDAAKAFYPPLFGWTTEDAGPPELTGGYGFFLSGGALVAGFGPQMGDGPPYWTSYVSVVDADATTEAVVAAGGSVVVPPMDVMTAGRMAVYQDAQGAFVSAWQPRDHIGATKVNEPGAYCWNELLSRDPEGAKPFYRDVFGWGAVTHAAGPMPYTEFQLGGSTIAGMAPMPAPVPASVPPHWNVYFAVADADATVARARELGGSVIMAPVDSPAGRFALLADPQRAPFGVIAIATG